MQGHDKCRPLLYVHISNLCVFFATKITNEIARVLQFLTHKIEFSRDVIAVTEHQTRR